MPAIQPHFSLKDYNSFRIDIKAGLFTAPTSIEELPGLMNQYDFRELPFLVIGEGSNLLFKEDFEGLVLNPHMYGFELIEKKGEEVVVSVGAAENWDNWVEYATQKGWFGLENLSSIPGSVGSAPVQNIGAYGVEIKDHFAWLEAWDLQLQKRVRLYEDDCKFGYRTSIFKTISPSRYIITHVAFRLSRQPQMKLDYGMVKEAFLKNGGSSPLDLRNTIINIRKQKLPDPEEYGNAGSFFKNPLVDRTIFKCIRLDFPEVPHFYADGNQIKLPAAWLIEQSGWKGKRIGNVGTWPTQPLVIVNYGGATGQEIVDFSEQVRNDVDNKFGIYLDREVNVI